MRRRAPEEIEEEAIVVVAAHAHRFDAVARRRARVVRELVALVVIEEEQAVRRPRLARDVRLVVRAAQARGRHARVLVRGVEREAREGERDRRGHDVAQPGARKREAQRQRDERVLDRQHIGQRVRAGAERWTLAGARRRRDEDLQADDGRRQQRAEAGTPADVAAQQQQGQERDRLEVRHFAEVRSHAPERGQGDGLDPGVTGGGRSKPGGVVSHGRAERVPGGGAVCGEEQRGAGQRPGARPGERAHPVVGRSGGARPKARHPRG